MRTKPRPRLAERPVDVRWLNAHLTRPWDAGLPPAPEGFESVAAAADDQLICALACTVGWRDA
jgi:hypothetical protein